MALLLTDPVCFKRDADGRLKFPLELARGLEGAAIGVRVRLGLFLGEFFANLEVGVPWAENDTVSEREAIIGEPYEPAKARAAIRREILTTPGVFDVPTLDLSFAAAERTLSVTYVARTRWGDTPRDTLVQEL